MRAFGVILVALGIVTLLYGGITYTKREKVVDFGPIEAYSHEKERIPLSPVAGGVAVVAGLVLIVTSSRRVQGG